MATQLAEAPEAVEEPVEAANDTETQTAPERDYEAEARAQGWRPKEEFRGNPDQWTDAETFMRRADEVLPLIKKQNAHLKSEIDQLKKMVKKVQASEQAAYTNALADLKARQEAAVETGDVAEFRQIDKQIDKLRTEISADTDTAHGEDPAEQFDAFRDANPWFDRANLAGASETDLNARAYADRLAEKYIRQGLDKELAPSAFFARVAQETAEKYPSLNAKAPRQKPPSDVAGVPRPGAPRNAKIGANLPAEAKDHAERYMRMGIFKVKTKAEAYDLMAKTYTGPWN